MLFISIILFLGAGVGHLALNAFTINWLHSTRFRCWWIKLYRRWAELFIVVGPFVFLYFWGWVIWPGGSWLDLPVALRLYLIPCWLLGFVIVPYQTVRRWLREIPAHQLSNHTQMLDVAQQIGTRPYGYGKRRILAYAPGNQIFQVDFTEKTFRLPQLPAAWDGLTILHLTDLHLCGTPDRIFYNRVMDACREPVPDLLAITGDILDSKRHYDWIDPVLGRLRWRLAAFAVLGNHDSWLDVPRIHQELDRAGIETIGGRWVMREIRGEPLVVIGNEMPWLPPAPDLSGCPKEGFRLCLSHTPDTFPWAKHHNIDLVLAGHNHGGQIRFPGIGPILVPSCYSRRYDCGTFYEAPTLMHVGRGLAGTYPIRYACRPEVTRIVLKKD